MSSGAGAGSVEAGQAQRVGDGAERQGSGQGRAWNRRARRRRAVVSSPDSAEAPRGARRE